MLGVPDFHVHFQFRAILAAKPGTLEAEQALYTLLLQVDSLLQERTLCVSAAHPVALHTTHTFRTLERSEYVVRAGKGTGAVILSPALL